MDCNNCALSIKNTLRKKGVADAEVNFATGEAFFSLPQNISLSEIKKTVEN